VSLVLDGSATLAWVYPEEAAAAIIQVLHAVIEDGAVVPDLWRIEIANSLTQGVRRSRLTIRERDAALQYLRDLDIAVDDETGLHI
jgi:predicted nucleic acid-binding protein